MDPLAPRPPSGPACSRPELGARLADRDLLEPSDQRALEEHAGACPRCAPELELLRRVDAWLADRTRRNPAGECPEAEDLYDFAKGPGGLVLPRPLRGSIEEHLARCEACAGFVATLVDRPPVPLVLGIEPGDSDPASLPAPASDAGHAGPAYLGPEPGITPSRLAEGPTSLPKPSPFPARRSRRRLHVTLALAAGLILAFVLSRGWLARPFRAGETEVAALRFPEPPLLRGELGGLLLYPREAVLAGVDGTPFHPLVFELDAMPRSSAYRAVLLRRGEDPLSEGEQVAEVSGASPTLELPREDALRLTPGRYTWEAWAVADGLTIPMGRRDFELRADVATLAELLELDARHEPERSERALALLVARGFPGDARAWARGLPASPERDAWLRLPPGR